jgi:acetyl esterase
MKRAIVLSVTLALTVASTVLSQEPRKQDTERAQQQPAPFQQVFTLRGIDFTQSQQAQVEELRKKYTPPLIEIQRKFGGVLTDEQRQAQREAFQAAREAGKQDAELRKALDAAVKLTDEQKEQQAKIQQERAALFAKIQEELRTLLTDEQRKQLRPQGEARGPAQPPTHQDVKYGPYDRNVMDVWLAESNKPTPVLVSIHGGGFSAGNKSVGPSLLAECLKSGVSVVAITYRLSDEAKAPAQFLDSARAIQFIRSKAQEWNLDASRMAATGGSAGAGISLWLGFHDDLADPKNEDLVLRQSTRLTCMAVVNGQTSYDPRFIRDLFPGTDTYKVGALAKLFDMDPNNLDQLPKEKYKLFEECSPITHLTKDDAPALLIYNTTPDTPITNQGIGIHHPKFGTALKEKMDALGIECQVATGIQGNEGAKLILDFVKRHLGMK